MRNKRSYKITLIALVGLFINHFVMAETSKEYAIMSHAIWSAFECSVLAEKIKNEKEKERLFMFGYKKGVVFIEALKLKK